MVLCPSVSAGMCGRCGWVWEELPSAFGMAATLGYEAGIAVMFGFGFLRYFIKMV